MNIRHLVLGVTLSTIGSLVYCDAAKAEFPFEEFELNAPQYNVPEHVAQKPATEMIDAAQPRLVEAVPSASDRSVTTPKVAELRMARAQYRSQQRLERLERNQWYGYEPLRPNWNAVPMMSSRYRYPSTIYVPVYYYAR